MRISFVQIADQVHYEPGTAQLAGLMKDRSWMPWHVLTDFSTTKEGFEHAVREREPVCVAFRVTKQTREIVQFFARSVLDQPENVPVMFYGPLCQSHPEEVAGLADPSVIFTGEPEIGMAALIDQWTADDAFPQAPPIGCWYYHGGEIHKGEDGAPIDLATTPKPDLTVFGGDRVFRRGIGSSFFGDLKVLPLLSGVGSPSGMPANNKLLNFCYPTSYEPRLVEVEQMIFRLRALGPRIRHFELWDREFGWDLEYAAKFLDKLQKRQRKKTYSLRVLAESFNEDLLDIPNTRWLRRVVTEYDAATPEHHEKAPGSQDPAGVQKIVEAAQQRGFEAALLVSVGLPFETVADVEAKLDYIRKSGVTAVRFVPFEPRYDHPVYALCEENGMLSDRGPSWNREVWRPIRQDSLPIEDWHVLWQKCLDVQAELQMRHTLDFVPTPT